MKNFKEKTIRGGVAKIFAQATTFSLRFGSLMVMARLLDPRDFGLVGMVTAFTGVLNLFRDFGLSAAAVQRAEVTEEQVSTLFWINVLVGAALTAITVAMAPVVAAFYHEPRLFWVTIVLACGFIVNATGVQHSAQLQRQMRFTTLAGLDVLSLAVSVAVGIVMALRGYGYWALVATAVVPTLVTTIGLWSVSSWIPGRPRRRSGVRSMLRFGGTLTLNGIVVYIAYNLDKILLGRWWGASAVGLYGRAYTLINIPTDNLNNAAGEVAFPALSRVQNDPVRLKHYFLKGYSLVLALTVPLTISGALFASDLIPVVLGPKWHDAIPIFRLLTPTMLIIAVINPLIWLVLSQGMVGRSFRVGLVYAPIVILGCIAGIPFGPVGVAIGYSAVLALWFIPHIAWCVHGTVVSLGDVLHTAGRPILSGLVGAAVALGMQFLYGSHLSPLPRLVVGNAILFSVYGAMLLYAMGQKAVYLDLVRGFRNSTGNEVSAEPSRFEAQTRGDSQVSPSAGSGPATSTELLFIACDYVPNPGGIASYLDNLARGLISLGSRVKVLALVEAHEKERRAFLDTYEEWVIPLQVAYDKRPENWFANRCISLLEIVRCLSPRAQKYLDKTTYFRASADSVALLEKVLAREKPALIVIGHLNLKFYPFILHLKNTQQPYGIIAHDSEVHRSQDEINDHIRRGMIIKNAKWIAANSHHTKSLVEAWGVPDENIIIVHPPLSEQTIRASQQHADNGDGVYGLVTVSRIVHNKGIDTVLHALKILDGRQIPFHYVIAGDGPERPSLEKLSVELGIDEKVWFAGCVTERDKLRLLQSADLYVMPSRVNLKEQHEGFGIAFLEAAACGIAAVGSNAGGIPDAVLDGKTGMLVESDSPEKLADALIFLYQNPLSRREMGRAGLERARNQFSPRAVAARFQREISRFSPIELRRSDSATSVLVGSALRPE